MDTIYSFRVVSTKPGQDHLIVSATLTACHCRVGNCLQIHPQSGSLTTVVQQDGMLTITGFDGNPNPGGIDADGAFWSGSVVEQTGTVVYSRGSGTFVLVNGRPDSYSETLESTAVVSTGGTNFDCDLRVEAMLRFQGP
jgi:hypothetical protein